MSCRARQILADLLPPVAVRFDSVCAMVEYHLLASISAGSELRAAVYLQDVAGDRTSVVGREKGYGRSDIVGLRQAIDLRGNLALGVGARPFYEAVRAAVPKLETDRKTGPDAMRALEALLAADLVRALRPLAEGAGLRLSL